MADPEVPAGRSNREAVSIPDRVLSETVPGRGGAGETDGKTLILILIVLTVVLCAGLSALALVLVSALREVAPLAILSFVELMESG